VRILLNGEWNEAQADDTVASLLARLGIDDRRVAVEHNLEILPRSRYPETRLSDGDRLEVVHFVGGG